LKLVRPDRREQTNWEEIAAHGLFIMLSVRFKDAILSRLISSHFDLKWQEDANLEAKYIFTWS